MDRNLDTMQVIVIVMVVALRKESVDRNLVAAVVWVAVVSRSPQGERG